MAGIRDLIADPEFQALPVGKQREAMSRFDPEFSKFDDSQIGEFKVKLAKPSGIIEKVFNPVGSGVTPVSETKQIRTISDVGRNVAETAKPFITGLGTAAGLAGAAMVPEISIPATAILGMSGGLGAHYATQMAQEGMGAEHQPILDTLQEGAGTVAGNEAGALLFPKLWQTFKGAVKPAEARANFIKNSPVAQRLQPIYDSMIEKGGGPSYAQQNPGVIKKQAENILGGQTKQDQLDNAARAGTKVGVDLSNKITGGNISEWEDPFIVAKRFGGDLEKTKNAYVTDSNRHAQLAKDIADQTEVPASANVLNGMGVMSPAQALAHKGAGGTTVKGPVRAINMIQSANKYLMETLGEDYFNKSEPSLFQIVADKEKPAVRTALDIMKYADRKIVSYQNANTPTYSPNIEGIRPMSFEQAWKFKKAASGIGYAGDDVVPTYEKSNFQKLGGAADTDIEDSMPLWRKNQTQALNSYGTAKALVSNRHDLYQQGDEIQRILQSGPSDSAKPQFDAVLNDPLKVGKAIAAAGPDGRKTLQGYQIQKLMQDSFDTATGTYNRDKLISDWKDPNKQGVIAKLYNQQQRNDIDNFFEALGNVSTKQTGTGKAATAFRVGSAGFHLAGSLLSTGLIAAKDTYAGLVVGGTIATSEIVKRILLDPKKARSLTILMNQGPASGEAKFLSRQVFAGLNGIRIALELKDGSKKGGIIENGKVTLDSQ